MLIKMMSKVAKNGEPDTNPDQFPQSLQLAAYKSQDSRDLLINGKNERKTP